MFNGLADSVTTLSKQPEKCGEVGEVHTALLAPRLDAVYLGSKPVGSLTELNDQLNDLFEVAR